MAINETWWRNPPKSLEDCLRIYNERIGFLNDDNAEGRALQKLLKRIKQEGENLSANARKKNPLAFVKLGWEQTLKCNAWVWGITWPIDFDANRKGKCLKKGTKVATPTGYKKIEQLKVRDQVLDHNGLPTLVIAVYPQKKKQLYKLIFNDGSFFECCAEHIHEILEPKHRFRPIPEHQNSLFTTQELIEKFGNFPSPQKAPAWPRTPIAFFNRKKELPIEPYNLGLLLGDGSFRNKSIRFTTNDLELLNSLKSEFPEAKFTLQGLYDYHITYCKLKDKIDSLGLFGLYSKEKFIPKKYKESSLDQRVAILQGLFDTDGTVCKNTGASYFYSTSEKLVNDVIEIIQSIGGIATKQKKFTKYKEEKVLSFVCYVRFCKLPLFRLSRKLEKTKLKNNRWKPNKVLVSISKSCIYESICIEVTNPNHTFLIEKGIVTHNTATSIFNALLWMFPNDPKWRMFAEEYVDDWYRRVFLIQRPSIEKVLKIAAYIKDHPALMGDPNFQPYDTCNIKKVATLQQELPDCFLSCYPEPPITDPENTMWHGAPDTTYHKEIVMKEWKKWCPQTSISRWSDYDQTVSLEIKYQIEDEEEARQVNWEIIFKSYETEETKWSGAAVAGILLTEGLRINILNEIRQRFKNEGFGHWDYTPYEPRNTGKKSAIAHKVFKGKIQLPLKPFVFTGFGIEKTPDFIIPTEKRADLIRMWTGTPEGQARLHGKFFESSGVVLTNLDSKFHTVPWTKEELFAKFPTGNLYRGLDPGLDHPCACAWGLLTPQNVWYIYRFYSKKGTSIPTRCQEIVELSGNKLRKRKYGKGEDDYHMEEFHPDHKSEVIVATITDYHAFKTDETTGRSYSLNYIKNGLTIIPSVTTGPEGRAQELDQLLQPDLTKAHPILQKPPGCKMYYLINEMGVAEALEKLENIFWDRYKSGERAGEPKDQIQDHEDDELDANCYLACSPNRWMNNLARRREPIEVATLQQRNQRRTSAFAVTG